MPEFKSTNVTRLDAGQLAVQGTHNAARRLYADTIEVTAMAVNDTVRLLRLPVDALLPVLRVGFDDLGSTGAVRIGVAYPSNYAAPGGNLGATIDDDAFASGIDVATAAVPMTDYRYALRNIDTAHQPLWQLAGLAARPACPELDIVITVNTATTAAGTISVLADAAVQP